MVGLTSRTAVPLEGFVAFDPNGHETFVVVAKATFALRPGGPVTMHEEQAPVVMADEFWGSVGASSVKYEADTAHRKPGTDLVLSGSAWAPGASPATQVIAEVATRTWRKQLLVT